MRLRFERMDRLDYAAAAPRNDLDMTVLRTRVSVDAAPAEGVRVFAELQDSRTAGAEASVVANSANVDLYQGFLELPALAGGPFSLKAGRFAMRYGDQRLVSDLDWAPTARAWDGARLRWSGQSAWVDAFATILNEFNGARGDLYFWGLYGSCKGLPGHEADAYVLARSGHPTAGYIFDYTAGARIKGARGALDYSGEGAYQLGRRYGKDVKAFAAAATAGWTLSSAWTPRVGLEYAFASGDSKPTDGTTRTFDPLFPFGHSYQGFADVVGWRNVHNGVVRVSAKPKAGMSLHADYHLFRLAQAKDAWYGVTGSAVKQDATGASGKDVGAELDLHLRAEVRKALKIWTGYSRFFAGDFASVTAGGKKAKDWFFFQATVDF